jgi:sugar lactone lactonase YvrE
MAEILRAKLAVELRDQLGEGPVWDAAQERLLWQDHISGIIREAKADGSGSADGTDRTGSAAGASGWRETRRWNLNRAIAASIPRARGGLVVPGGMEVFLMDDAGTLTSFARIENESPLARINDAKCDARGRLWVGTLTSNFEPGGAALYRIDPNGSVTAAVRNVTLANGLDWSPDGKTFYFVDSFTRSVDAFDFDLDSGAIDNRRTIVSLSQGVPNGMTVDRSGNLWVAATGGGNVQVFSPAGEWLRAIEIGTPGATSCAFGGHDFAHLFITSRAGRMPDAAKGLGVAPNMMDNSGPEAGGLFVCQPGAQGLPSHTFAG